MRENNRVTCLHSKEWAQEYKGCLGDYTYRLADDITAIVLESDPMWLAVFFVNGEPVAGESCIIHHKAWAAETAQDRDFLDMLRTL